MPRGSKIVFCIYSGKLIPDTRWTITASRVYPELE